LPDWHRGGQGAQAKDQHTLMGNMRRIFITKAAAGLRPSRMTTVLVFQVKRDNGQQAGSHAHRTQERKENPLQKRDHAKGEGRKQLVPGRQRPKREPWSLLRAQRAVAEHRKKEKKKVRREKKKHRRRKTFALRRKN